ncbi:TPA: hypothetical protein DIC40_02555 [Patescibacteria group bacterium]|nr:hypothetical protein [Candidatus Gracilibacteria bacterium]
MIDEELNLIKSKTMILRYMIISVNLEVILCEKTKNFDYLELLQDMHDLEDQKTILMNTI